MQEQQDVLARLRRIEGQIRGLQKMIEEERDCASVVTQLSAVRSALDQVGFVILSNRMEECLRLKIEEGEAGEALDQAMKLFRMLA